jgi:hypothetical protein
VVRRIVPSLVTRNIAATPRLIHEEGSHLVGSVVGGVLTLPTGILLTARRRARVVADSASSAGVSSCSPFGDSGTKRVAEHGPTYPASALVMAVAMLVIVATGGAATLILFASAPWLAASALAAPSLRVRCA